MSSYIYKKAKAAIDFLETYIDVCKAASNEKIIQEAFECEIIIERVKAIDLEDAYLYEAQLTEMQRQTISDLFDRAASLGERMLEIFDDFKPGQKEVFVRQVKENILNAMTLEITNQTKIDYYLSKYPEFKPIIEYEKREIPKRLQHWDENRKRQNGK